MVGSRGLDKGTIMKTYDEEIARLCKAIRENNETEALNRAVGLLASFMNTQAEIEAQLQLLNSNVAAFIERSIHEPGMREF